MTGHLLDSGILSRIRTSGLTAVAWVGDDDLAVPEVAVYEIQRGLPRDDPKSIGNLALLATLPPALVVTEEIIRTAQRLEQEYARHDPALATNVALIVATALVTDRTVITLNTRDFHFERGLRWIDANGFKAADAPLLQSRAAVEAQPGTRPCCARVRST